VTFVKSIEVTPTVLNPETFDENKGIKIVLNVQKVRQAFALGDEDDVIYDILKAVHEVKDSLCYGSQFMKFPVSKKQHFKPFTARFK
jgi:hypothetical protein